jgi:hypothetical protein
VCSVCSWISTLCFEIGVIYLPGKKIKIEENAINNLYYATMQ